MNEPVPFAAAMAKLREKAEQQKRLLDADPELRAAIDRRIAEHEASLRQDATRWREAALSQAGVPRRMWADLGSLRDTEAVMAVKAWKQSGKTFLVLEGGVGVGKTYAAADFCASPGAVFIKADALARLSSFDTAAWDKLYKAPRVALDDLGCERLDEKGWALGAIQGFIDRRYDEAMPTVITTNLGMDAIRQRYGQDGGRLFDRLRETAEWVQLGGESLRAPVKHWSEKDDAE